MDSVKVALRIRPLVKSETDNGCQSCIERIPGEPQVGIGKANQTFTFNYVFDEYEGQGKVYNDAVAHLIENLFKGYNLTILAYGQTGSGKTFTMGTNYSGHGEMGVIPRAIYDIFDFISRQSENNIKVSVSFIELYNESLFDLLTNKPREQSIVDMREHNNTVVMPGLTELAVTTPDDTLNSLKEGSLGRMVGATAMNAQSSRSHAIFTVNIKIIPKENPKESIVSKFHLVDLAGSERSKKTGATGDRFREGVNINKGLLVLGNVISQLGEGNHSFINYRDSKLTRLLQDSLGGNSVTLMIACVSPADYNLEESLSTLRYADRAKKIKNKPVINQDPFVAELSRLRKENEELRLKIIEGGVTTLECPPNHKFLELNILEKDKMIKELQTKLVSTLAQNAKEFERNLMEEKMRNTLEEKLSHLIDICENVDKDPSAIKPLSEIKSMIFDVKADFIRSEDERITFEKQCQMPCTMPGIGMDDDDDEDDNTCSPMKQEHVVSQSLINEQILEITKKLAMKEELVSKMCEKSDYLTTMQNSSEESIKELKIQIAELQKEKEELLHQLKQSSSDKCNSSKIAEQRRKRLQELEQKVGVLMKKIVEQERIIKIKENSDCKILNMKREIMGMKQLKVRLVQQMKSENEKFRSWRAQKDKEVHSLKNENFKKQNQMKKMEQIHSLKQNVLKRKLEAAAAANKRIMAVLERQKMSRTKHRKSILEEIKDRVDEELDLIESSYQAEKSLETLIQDRAALTGELNNVKEKLKTVCVDVSEKEMLLCDKKKLEHELALRSAEISDLQQKLSDIEDGLKKNTWEMVEAQADAKQALIYVFNLLTEKVKECLKKTYILAENEAIKNDKMEEVEEYKQKLDEERECYNRRLEAMEKESEEQMIALCKHISSRHVEQNPDSDVSRALSEQMEIIASLQQKMKSLEETNQLRGSQHNNNFMISKISSYQDVFKKFIDKEFSTNIFKEEDGKTSRKSRLTGTFHKMSCQEDSHPSKENFQPNVLNRTFTTKMDEDIAQEDMDYLNELGPKRKRKQSSTDAGPVLHQLNKNF